MVLHALDLAPYNRGIRTEVDFVAVIPDTGILCIEVKSHSDISFREDRWHPSDIKRSPFKQAADGRFTFHRRLCKLAPICTRIPVLHLCIFPNAQFDLSPNLSVQPWELIDQRVFRSFASAQQFCSDLKVRMLSGIKADTNLVPLRGKITGEQVECIVGLCVPVQKSRPDWRTEIELREKEAERVLREQQKPVLQLASLNRQLVVTGPAGTGKTLIAMELARRKAAAGTRTGLLCFNRLVGHWMREQVEKTQPPLPNLVVGPAIKVMAEMAGVTTPEHPTHEYWEVTLPETLQDRLTDPDFQAEAVFDYLILDEAQDLLARPEIWGCLSQFLRGGFTSGGYVLFGDVENQAIEDRPQMCKTLDELHAISHPARWVLSENCRNYPIVGDTAAALSGFRRSIYSGYLRSGGSVKNYNLLFYQDTAGQVEMLRNLLKQFRSEGYKQREIVLLSFCAPEVSVAAALMDKGVRLRPLWKSEDEIGYGSIHGFKGMESKIVIMTDVVLDDLQVHRTLFYVGMTRATESVRILCDASSMKTLSGWITKGGDHA